MGFKRLLPKVLYPLDLEFDVLIATHPHFDHFDMDSIPMMMANHHTKLYASVNCEQEVRRLHMTGENCIYVKAGEQAEAGDFHIQFVDCDHGTGAPDAFGVIIKMDGKTIYMAGDTCQHIEWAEKLKSEHSFDVVIGPINGAYGNMDEAQFAEYAHVLGGKVSIPCHYGMFASHGGNPGKFLEIMRESYPENHALLMFPGEKLVL